MIIKSERQISSIRHIYTGLVILLVVFTLVLTSSGQSLPERKLLGRILDVHTEKPLKDVNIVIRGTTSGTVSNYLGFFELTVQPSEHKALVASHIGYSTIEIEIPQQDKFVFSMQKEYLELRPLDLNQYPNQIPLPAIPEPSTESSPDGLQVVEANAWYPGGVELFYQYVGNTLIAAAPVTDGLNVNIRFTINEEGGATAISLSDSTNMSYQTVRNAFHHMPKWTPATQRQKKVSQHFSLNVTKSGVVSASSEFLAYIANSCRYPATARRMGVEGVVFAEFQLTESGEVIIVKLLQDIGAECGAEAARVIANTPREVAKSLIRNQDGSRFVLPVAFGLERPFPTKTFGPVRDAVLLPVVNVVAIGIARKSTIGPSAGITAPPPNNYTNMAEAMKNPKRVQRLFLENQGLESLPEEVLRLTNLTFLNLERNRLSKLPASISELTKLEELYLFSNQIEDFPVGVEGLSKLKILALGSNKLRSVSPVVAKLEKLEILDLSNNSIESLPSEIGGMKSLRILLLQNNSVKQLPDEIYSLKKLEQIHLHGNPIEPNEIEQLRRSMKSVEVVF